jgi:curved DNA-binding protein CbpA
MSNNYDPYKILQVSYTADLNTIRDAFKKQALLHHPDRGGNPYHFDLCRKAYADIYSYKMQQQKQLQKESRNLTQMKMQRTSNYGTQLNRTQQKQLQRNFNQIFQNVRVDTPNDVGYGDMMETSSKSRDDNPTLNPSKRFKKNQLVLYEEPEPLSTLNQNYEVLGENNIKDFGNKSFGGMQYTDYMVAHSEKDSIEKLSQFENVKKRPTYRSVDQLRSARSNISYQMSPEDQQKYELKKYREQEMEEKRKMQFYQHVQNVEKKFNQIHNYLTY